jgi:hypothetical protein
MPHYLLFSGHMIDKPGRNPPRFPETKAEAAAEAIRNALEKVLNATAGQTATAGSSLKAISAAACGGDILFHEACRDLHIPSELYLALPIEAFLQTSVAFAGPSWISRYRQLTQTLPVHILHPEATADAPDTIWEEANQWMLDAALQNGPAHLTLIALWDGNTGDTGGTAHMISVAQSQHAATEILHI